MNFVLFATCFILFVLGSFVFFWGLAGLFSTFWVSYIMSNNKNDNGEDYTAEEILADGRMSNIYISFILLASGLTLMVSPVFFNLFR